MKAKRFLALAALVCLLAAACIGTLVTAAADTSVSSYFTLPDGVSANLDEGKIEFNVTAGEEGESYTVTSVYDFFLPALKISGTATGLTVKVNGLEYTLGSGTLGTLDKDLEAGKLEFELTPTGEGDHKLTIDSMAYVDGETEKNLYTIEDRDLKPINDSAYLDDDSFMFYDLDNRKDEGGNIVWGYNYDSVNYSVYHGFITGTNSIGKELLVFYGTQEKNQEAYDYYNEFFTGNAEGSSESATDSSASNSSSGDRTIEEIIEDGYGVKLKRYTSFDATVKFTDNTLGDTVIDIYYGHYNYGGYHHIQPEVKDELPDKAPEYVDLYEKFYVHAGEGEEATGYEAYLEDIYNEYTVEGEGEEAERLPKFIGSSTYFEIPAAIYDYIESPYFSNKNLTKEIHYKLPNNSSFTTLSSSSTTKRFSLTQLGIYEYYVLAIDPQNNKLEIDEEKWKLTYGTIESYTDDEGNPIKVYGYWSMNDGGTPDDDKDDTPDKLMVPVFRFKLSNRGPQVTAGSSYQDNGYVGSVYTNVSSFTVRGNDYSTQYSLWYNSNMDAAELTDEQGSGWVEIGTEEAFEKAAEQFKWSEDITFDKLSWSTSSLAFTPVATGSYVVRCEARDSEARLASANTRVIRVRTEMRRVSPNTTAIWFERNWRSVLFLGIAFLSLVGIIALIFVKPKEEENKPE